MVEPERAIGEDRDGEATTRIQPAEVLEVLEEHTDTAVMRHRKAESPLLAWWRRIRRWLKAD